MTLDLNTLHFASAASRCAYVVVFLVMALSQRRQAYLWQWMGAMGTSMAGSLIMMSASPDDPAPRSGHDARLLAVRREPRPGLDRAAQLLRAARERWGSASVSRSSRACSIRGCSVSACPPGCRSRRSSPPASCWPSWRCTRPFASRPGPNGSGRNPSKPWRSGSMRSSSSSRSGCSSAPTCRSPRPRARASP